MNGMNAVNIVISVISFVWSSSRRRSYECDYRTNDCIAFNLIPDQHTLHSSSNGSVYILFLSSDEPGSPITLHPIDVVFNAD